MSIVALHANYVAISTGHTARLVGKNVVEKMIEESRGNVSVACIKDDIDKVSWYHPVDKPILEKAVATLEDGITGFSNGSIIFRLNTDVARQNPLSALAHFVRRFGSDTNGRYCGNFDGIPKQQFQFKHESHGMEWNIVVFVFDCESG